MKIKQLFFIPLALMGLSSGNAAMVLHYTLDDDGGGQAINTNSGTGVHSWGSTAGGATTTGKFGEAADFTTGGWWSNASTGVDLSSFTLSLHVRTSATAKWDDFITIGTGANVVFALEQAGDVTGGLSVSLFNIGSVGGVATPGINSGEVSGPVNDGNWHHLGIVSDGSEVKLFMDGVERGSAAYTGTGNIDAIQFASRFGDSARKIVTDLDDVALYNTALSSSQMGWLSNNAAIGVPVPEPSAFALFGVGAVTALFRRRR